jgi:hypothetical protein
MTGSAASRRSAGPWVVAAVLVFLVVLMRRSVAEKGAHIGAE